MKNWKKICCILLSVLLLSSLAACGGEEQVSTEPEATPLRVGFGRADITPETSVRLHGYPTSTRFSTSVLDPLYATCIAITDQDENTIILFHMDLTSTWGDSAAFQRKAVSDATGVPFHNIAIAATHTHSAPHLGYRNDDTHPNESNYALMVEERMVEAAKDAMADRAECTMEYGAAYPVGLNFVRHYVMDDGSVIGDGFGDDLGKTYIGHVHDVDNQLQVLRFVRQEKQDVVMCNFQSHPLLIGNSALDARVSSDFIGPMRDYMEKQLDCNFIYFTAGSGNVDPLSRIKAENAAVDYVDHGQQLARYAIMALSDTVEIPSGKVQALYRDVPVYINKNKSDMRLQTLVAGGLCFGSPPYEMFDTNAKFVKDHSPYEATFMLYLSNSGNGYVAEESAYRYGGYEVEYTGFNKGTAEILADHFVDMLYEMRGTENPNAVRDYSAWED